MSGTLVKDLGVSAVDRRVTAPLSVIAVVRDSQSVVAQKYVDIDRALRGCVDGADAQILFIDIGSIDRTREHLESYAAKDSRIRLVRLERDLSEAEVLVSARDEVTGEVVVELSPSGQLTPHSLGTAIGLMMAVTQV